MAEKKISFPETLLKLPPGITPNLARAEELIADYWEQAQIFPKQLEQTQGKSEYVFYDGPPFATGLPHYGHLLASTTKDVFPRFHTMLGQHVSRIWGWDCHGLPIENIIEKDLGLKDRRQIENYGVGNFCESCRSKVQLYTQQWQRTIKRLGRFVDMEHAYKTMDPEFMNTQWRVFGELWDKGLVYNDYKPMHICPRCGTPLSNFEVSLNYKSVTDISLYPKFKLARPHDLNLPGDTYLVAWTTTAWTLPGNMLLAVDNELEYAIIETLNPTTQTPEYLIIASALVSATMGQQAYKIIRTLPGSELVGRTYLPLMPYFADTPGAFRVVDADFVATDEGTGIVHIAPAFGENDFYLGQREGLPVRPHVSLDGKILPSVTDFAGMAVRDPADPQAIDVAIIKYLAPRGAILRKQKITHSYPHCWRCDHALLNYATSSYFIKVTAFKDTLLTCNQQVNWLPENFRDGRMGKWLEGARDWAVSRNRFWGTPIPLWRSEQGDWLCVKSQAELEKLTGQKVPDLHKHFVDNLVIKQNGQTYRRIGEVFDCWFESGSMPYYSDHFPADFISEGQDQTRGWFYTLLVLSAALKGQPAFKNVIVSGIILAADGKKMSKKLGNYPDPQIIFNRYGADALRLYLMTSPVIKAESLNFNEPDVARLYRQVNVMTWNCFAFYRQWQNLKLADFTNEQTLAANSPRWHLLDRYLFWRTQELTLSVSRSLLTYQVIKAGRALIDFVAELSTFYLRLSRERLKVEPESQKVLGWSLWRLAHLLAPIMPFLSELLYQNLGGEKQSVHLEPWPLTLAQIETSKKIKTGDQDLAAKITLLREIMTLGNSERKKLGVKNRQPLASIQITAPSAQIDLLALDMQLQDVIASELNVKKIITPQSVYVPATGQLQLQLAAKKLPSTKKNLQLTFDAQLTPDLIVEGQARELMRQIAQERKQAGLQPQDDWTYQVSAIPKGWQKEIETKTHTKLSLKK